MLGNLTNLSLLSAAVPGPEGLLAGRPLLLVTLIGVQVVLTQVLVGVLSRSTTRGGSGSVDARAPVVVRARASHAAPN